MLPAATQLSARAPPIPRVNSPLNTAVSPLASIAATAIFAEAILRQGQVQGLLNAGPASSALRICGPSDGRVMF